jgi:hypothetical protein
MNETDTQTERYFTPLEWHQREADFTAMIAVKDELLAGQSKRMIEMQAALERALSMPADPGALEAEQTKRMRLEDELKAIKATASQSDTDRTTAIEQLNARSDKAEG